MDDRVTGAVAVLVGLALAVVGTREYLLPGLVPPPLDPFTSGVLVVATGLLLVVAGALAVSARLDHLALRTVTGVGVIALTLAVRVPEALLFGGVFWLALVAVGLVGAGAYRTVSNVR